MGQVCLWWQRKYNPCIHLDCTGWKPDLTHIVLTNMKNTSFKLGFIQKYNIIINITLLVASIIITLTVLEITLQFLDIPETAHSGWRARQSPQNEWNQLRFRGQNIEYNEDDFVILLTGDSQVAANCCSFEELPEQRLEYHLNAMNPPKHVKVFSIGEGGYGQDQVLITMQEYFQTYRADLVLNWITPDNDVWNNTFPTHYPKDGRPKPTFWLEDGKLKGPHEVMGKQTPRFKLLAIYRNFINYSPDEAWEVYLPTPYHPVKASLEPPNYGEVSYRWQELWGAGKPNKMLHENLANEKAHLSIYLIPTSERVRYGLDLTRALFTEIQHLTVSNNGQFVLFVVRRNDVTRLEPDGKPHVYFFQEKYYEASFTQMEKNLAYMTDGFDFYAISVQGSDYRVSETNAHLNTKANDQVMHDLAKKTIGYIR